MRRFHLQRDEDESGVSGTGRVAEGVLLNNGWVVLEWHSHHKEISISESMAVFEALHGHSGKAHIVWHDPDPYEEKKKNGQHTADAQGSSDQEADEETSPGKAREADEALSRDQGTDPEEEGEAQGDKEREPPAPNES